ncbi:hypothetical protein GCM10025794_23320 [Massilia kyonggiensis]
MTDVCGHGTAVAGSAAATSNNATGVAGVAGAASIMPLRIAYTDSTGCHAYFSTIASGLTYAADHGARVANVSYSGVAGSASILSAARYMKSKGGLVFVSAGNNNVDENVVPDPALVVVSATDGNDAKASFSSWGSFVTIAAPGTNIWTTNNSLGYSAWNGTSFSAPVTAGVAALMMAARPELGGDTIQLPAAVALAPFRAVPDIARTHPFPVAAHPGVAVAVPVPVTRRPLVAVARGRHDFVARRRRRGADDDDIPGERLRRQDGGGAHDGKGGGCKNAFHGGSPLVAL